MLQHLLNTTATWLLCLIVFDLFLRKESYHSYNRLYLLLTFMLGILLPLIQWQDNTVFYSAGMAQPIATVVHTKQTVAQAATIQNTQSVNWLQWIWLAYWAGVAISSLLLLKDVVILSRYFKTGTRSRDGIWHIVETGKQHGPFSVFRHIFISSRNDYNASELHMILTHEKQHGRSLHFIDLFLMELAKIVFWFHPLVYLFQRRLLILHEYQADAAVKKSSHEYGQFLIQQSMLQTAPPLSHSLNRSPIKNRILMLTRTSSFKAGFKRLVAIPLCIACIFLFTNHAVSQGISSDEKTFTYNGNTFELKAKKLYPEHVANSAQYNLLAHTTGAPDSITAQNPRTGAFETVTPVIVHYPAKMNGRNIYTPADLSKTEMDVANNTTVAEINNYLLAELAPLIGNLNNGYYDLYDYIIVDGEGKVVYINQDQSSEYNKTELAKKLEKEVIEATAKTDKLFTPVKRGGKPEIMRLSRRALQIKNGKAAIIEPGC